jgi:hypothetical protein
MNKPATQSSRPQTGSRFTVETTLYGLAFLLALALRLLNLGQAPLTDGEATWALQALQVARPADGAFLPEPQPAYIFLTGLTFAIFGVSEFWARFWPALAGALLVWAVFPFRHSLGRKTALILAFGLAMDPGLVTVARQAGGPMLALGFSLLALAQWQARRPAWAGLLGGLAVLSGPSFWAGALGLGLAWLIHRALRRAAAHPAEVFDESSPTTRFPTRPEAIRGLAAFLASLLAVGTYLFRYPQGLGAAFDSLVTYLEGWGTSSGVSPLTLAAALLFFQPLALIFALVSLGRWLMQRQRDESRQAYRLLQPLLWFLTSLALALLYPSRQVNDLVWVLVPLLALGADGLARYLPDQKPHILSWLQAGLVLVLAALFWNTLLATSQVMPAGNLPWPWIQAGILAGIFLLGALTTALVALGWSWQISRDGMVWGLAAALLLFSTSLLWGSAQLRPNQPHELWGQPPGAGQVDLALATLRDLSNWHTGLERKLELVSTVDAPSLRWALRDYASARFIDAIPPGEMPPVILTRQSAQAPALTAAYRGQDFVWWVHPGWEGPLPDDIVDWLTARKAALGYEYIILWARSDLFPGGSSAAGAAP